MKKNILRLVIGVGLVGTCYALKKYTEIDDDVIDVDYIEVEEPVSNVINVKFDDVDVM